MITHRKQRLVRHDRQKTILEPLLAGANRLWPLLPTIFVLSNIMVPLIHILQGMGSSGWGTEPSSREPLGTVSGVWPSASINSMRQWVLTSKKEQKEQKLFEELKKRSASNLKNYYVLILWILLNRQFSTEAADIQSRRKGMSSRNITAAIIQGKEVIWIKKSALPPGDTERTWWMQRLWNLCSWTTCKAALPFFFFYF